MCRNIASRNLDTLGRYSMNHKVVRKCNTDYIHVLSIMFEVGAFWCAKNAHHWLWRLPSLLTHTFSYRYFWTMWSIVDFCLPIQIIFVEFVETILDGLSTWKCVGYPPYASHCSFQEEAGSVCSGRKWSLKTFLCYLYDILVNLWFSL